MLKKFKKSIICILDINFTLIKKNNCFLKVVCYNDNRGEYMKTIKNEKGFSLVELLAVLVILALLAILAGGTVMNVINKAESQVTTTQERAILSAAEKWSVDNSEKFDDIEGTKVQVGLDIVFVVDVSGSMRYSMSCTSSCSALSSSKYKDTRYYAAVEAINGALEVLRNNPKSRISFVFYEGTIDTVINLTPASSISDLIANSGSSIKVQGKTVTVSGGTYTQRGFVRAGSILANSANKENQIPVIILLTDGEPTYGYGPGNVTTTPTYVSNPLNEYGSNQGSGSSFSNAIGWNLIYNSSVTRDAIKSAYGVEPFIYTIGVGLEDDYVQFVLDPSEEKFEAMQTGTTKGRNLYNFIKSKMYVSGAYQDRYDYVTQSFYGKMDTTDLNQYFREIANQVTDAAKVTQVCVTVKDLYDGGYLSTDDIELADGAAASTYVIMNFNEATNQYNFSLAKTVEQENDCKKLLEGSA